MAPVAGAHGTIRLVRMLLTISSLSISMLGCSDPPGLERDLERPKINITYPVDGAILGDSVLIMTQASDNESPVEADFIIDGIPEYTDFSSPFLYLWRPESCEIGSVHTLQAAVYDRSGNRGLSDVVCVHYQWRSLIDDADDPWEGDLLRAYARDDSTVLEFLVEIDCSLETCRDEVSVATGVFLNTDLDSATGWQQHPVGADYAAWAYFEQGYIEGPWLYKWDSINHLWFILGEIESPGYSPDHRTFHVQLSPPDIGEPDAVGIVFWGNLETWKADLDDWAPDMDQTPIIYALDGSYIGLRTEDGGTRGKCHLIPTRGRLLYP